MHLLTFLVLTLPSAEAADYKKSAGPAAVEVLRLDWKDEKRDRVVPVKVYLPAGTTRCPVILFSHGLGGSREGYEYVGRHWASHGYVCVHLQHPGSDESVWKGKAKALPELRQAARTPGAAVARALDVRLALDRLAVLHRDEGPLRGRLDLARVGMAGHSFGAQTTQTVCGQTFFGPLGRGVRLAEPRIKAAVAMSPAAYGSRGDHKKAFATIEMPMLHLTGTRDDGVAITEVKPAERRIPFDSIAAAHQYLVIFRDGDHAVFGGRRRPGTSDARFHDLIRMSTTAFWDAHLRGDEKARQWLRTEFPRALGGQGTFEHRPR